MKFFYATFKKESKYRDYYYPVVAKHAYDVKKHIQKTKYGNSLQNIVPLDSYSDLAYLDKTFLGIIINKRNLIFSLGYDDVRDYLQRDYVYFDVWFADSVASSTNVDTVITLNNIHTNSYLEYFQYTKYGKSTTGDRAWLFNPTQKILNKYFKSLYPTFVKNGRGRYIKHSGRIRRIYRILVFSGDDFFAIVAELFPKHEDGVFESVYLFYYDKNSATIENDLKKPLIYKDYE